MLDCSAESAPGFPRKHALPRPPHGQGHGLRPGAPRSSPALPPGPGFIGEAEKRRGRAEPAAAAGRRGRGAAREAQSRSSGSTAPAPLPPLSRPIPAPFPPHSRSLPEVGLRPPEAAERGNGAGREGGQDGPDAGGAVLRCDLPVLLAGVRGERSAEGGRPFPGPELWRPAGPAAASLSEGPLKGSSAGRLQAAPFAPIGTFSLSEWCLGFSLAC